MYVVNLEILKSYKQRTAFVYRHIRPDVNEVFYIGVGFNSKRRVLDKKQRNPHWKHIVDSCEGKFKAEIFMDELTPYEAVMKERELINLYGRRDLGNGTLVNLTDGGEGACGRKRTPQTQENITKTMLLRGKRFGVVTHTDEVKKKISEAGRRRTLSAHQREILLKVNLGRKRTQEERDKMSKAHTNWAIKKLLERVSYVDSIDKNVPQFAEKRSGIKRSIISVQYSKKFPSIRSFCSYYNVSRIMTAYILKNKLHINIISTQ